ncbi:MAG: hypothetical protein EZS28_049582, partial [Streblomastix strix]
MYYVVVCTVIKVYDSLHNDMVGGNSFVIHRENIAGKTQIHKFKLQDNEFLWFLMYMPGGVKYAIHDEEQAKQFIFNKHRFSSDEDIINKNVHLFIAKVKAHIPNEYINEFTNFPVIWRNLKIITDKDTVDRCHLVIDDIKQLIVFNKHCQFNEFVKTIINLRCKAHIEGNKSEELKNKLEVNTAFGYDSINSEKYKVCRLCNKKN